MVMNLSSSMEWSGSANVADKGSWKTVTASSKEIACFLIIGEFQFKVHQVSPMKFYFHPEAVAEFDAAVAYYEERQPGLGFEFTEEVYATIARINEYPDAWSPMSENTRRCLLNLSGRYSPKLAAE